MKTQDPAPTRRVLQWVYTHPGWFPALVDFGAWIVAALVVTVISLVGPGPSFSLGTSLSLGLVGVAVQAAGGYFVGTYRHHWRISSFDEAVFTAESWLLASVVVLIVNLWVLPHSGPTQSGGQAMGIAVVAFVLIGYSRVVWRRFWDRHRRPDPRSAKRTIVLGTGERTDQVVRLMMHDPAGAYFPVGLLDDQYARRNRIVHGVRVRGGRADLQRIAKEQRADMVLAVLDDAHPIELSELAHESADSGLELRVMPSTSQLVHAATLSDIRPPTVEDLLGRDPVEIDLASVSGVISGKRVLVTGAGGSIGSELSQQIDKFNPSALFLLDRDETALHSLQLSMHGHGLLDSDELIVADIRDRERMFELFDEIRPDVVFHTAALKHLTLLERFPLEAAKTNTLGTKNLIDAATRSGVERFVNISTDKAAEPTSALGASKLLAERVTSQAAHDTGRPYVSVRFGNVLGSRGSVLPTFLAQIESGEPLTVTDPEATRYFMTIPEAVRLVVQASAIGHPGEVMILDMGEPVKIDDLARQLINTYKPGHPVNYTGLRTGEKLHEVLVGGSETVATREHPRILHTRCVATGLVCSSAGDGKEVLSAMKKMMNNPPTAETNVHTAKPGTSTPTAEVG